MTGKSYKLEFKISYDDGEKSYETDKYVFVKTTAKEKPSENQGGNANGGMSVIVKGGITREDKIAFPYGKTAKEGVKTKDISLEELYQ